VPLSRIPPVLKRLTRMPRVANVNWGESLK
jgi:hypothetical protein